MRSILTFITFVLCCDLASALQLISWNVESGGADPAVIASQLAELPKVDAYLLQEVSVRDIGRYGAAIRETHGKSYRYYVGSLGGGDRLAYIIDDERFGIFSFTELLNFEKHRLNDWRHRPPLVAELRRKSDSQKFLLVNVHLARRDAKLREEQAIGLREWAKAQEETVILAGDCNFDFNFRTQRGNDAHRAFFVGGIWQEVVPEKRIDTNWSDRDGDGRDNYPDSALDFVAYKANGKRIKAQSRVIIRDGDFPDTKATSDHRPVFLNATF